MRAAGPWVGPAAVRSPERPGGICECQAGSFVGWRFGRLLGAGVEARLALRLPERVDVDIHEVMTLVGGGCPAALAARIAEPPER
jgi:hypothetical protein